MCLFIKKILRSKNCFQNGFMLVSEQGPFMEINLKLKLSLAERHQIIELHKFSRFSQRNIAKKFGCSKAQIQTTLDNREYY